MTINIKRSLKDRDELTLPYKVAIIVAYIFMFLILLDYTLNITHGLLIALGIFYLICLRMSRNSKVYFHIKIVVLIALIWVICRLSVLFLTGA
ncbi:MAG: hypothetical protein HVN34_06940 [Methanobacteriaceae archaeon]|nr:hypothetical protein [Methanobacteriaceae archaeon]